MTDISIIACIAKGNRAIGYKNRLLYHIKSDMARFRKLTKYHVVIMGRKTFDSLPHGALEDRRNIVVSRHDEEPPEDCDLYNALEHALLIEKDMLEQGELGWYVAKDELFVIGGASIYEQALPFATKLYLTVVDDTPEKADAFFPEIDLMEWEEVEKEMRNENGIAFTFLTYRRVKNIFPMLSLLQKTEEP